MNSEMLNQPDSPTPMDEQPSNDDMLALPTNNSSSASDERDRKQFTLEIHRFMAEVGKPLSKIPIMGYKELDLYQLFKEVTAHGGFNEVVKNVGTWSKIWKRLGNFDPSITDSSFRLKKNYERYLLEYEFKCFPDHRLQAMEFQEKSSLKRSSSSNNFNLTHPTNFSQNTRPHSPSSVSTSTTLSSSSSSVNIQISHASSTGPNFLTHKQDSESSLQISPSFSRKSTLSSSTSTPNLSSLANSNSPKVLKKKRKSLRDLPSRSNSFNSTAPTGSPYNSPSRSSSTNNLHALTSLGFPLTFGDLTVESLGTVIPRYPYVVNGQVYPIGFSSSRMYTSRINPEKQVKYLSQILESGDGPEFVVTASDDPEHPIVSRENPSECWRQILLYFMEIDESSEVSSEELSVCGRMRFGLTQPEVVSLMRELPYYHKAVESTGSLSPTTKRKHQNSDEHVDIAMKAPKFKPYMTRSSSTTNLSSRGDDIGDLESAVATLQGLKYCLVF